MSNPYPEHAKFFGIDQKKLEEEKRAMLDACRQLHEPKHANPAK